MGIPKIIFQTFKNKELPFMARLMQHWHKWLNPDYRYEFYDDKRILEFVTSVYEPSISNAYARLDIGAAKADFFRYLALFHFGGVYLDLDAYMTKPLDKFIQTTDQAIITKERNEGIFAQYALVFSAQHPILKKCIETICDNIEQQKHLYDIHKLTGPSVFTYAVNWYLQQNPNDTSTRIFSIDYNGYIKPKYWLHRGLFSKREKWQKAQASRPAVKA